MASKRAEIKCQWDQLGHISHTFPKGGNFEHNRDMVFAPSLPMLISHQLGTFRPSHGLILCSKILQYYLRNKHTTVPINSALKGADIQFVKTSQGMLITFHPKHSIFANSDSLEEGVRQFVNNYIRYVNDNIKRDTFQIVRGIMGSIISGYIDLLNEMFNRKRIGPRLDKWSPDFQQHMIGASLSVGEAYRATFPPDVDPDHVESVFIEQGTELEARLEKISRGMGIVA